ncbi:HIT-type Zinc finger family protein [Pelomyxa schiedti]|nr:HIT-type Zinc finger family protein [Pelomyxa schiedti]
MNNAPGVHRQGFQIDIDSIVLCYVVGANSHVDELFGLLTRLGFYTTRITVHNNSIITVNRPTLNLELGPPSIHGEALSRCDKVKLYNPPSRKSRKKSGFIFYRCNRDDKLTNVHLHRDAWLKGSAIKVVMMLHDAWGLDSLAHVLSSLLQGSIHGDVSPPFGPLVMVDCSGPSDATTAAFPIQAVEMAITQFCAFKMVKWTPTERSSLESLLSLITEGSKQKISMCSNAKDEIQEWKHIKPTGPLPIFTAPSVLKVHSADATDAHIIMKLVHDCSSHTYFPNLTVTMALRMWVRAKNWAAVRVVCRARSLTQFEDIDLSHLSLETVPEQLNDLSFRTLNLSKNKINGVPKWLSEMPNIILGEGEKRENAPVEAIVKQQGICTHKLVFVGDTGVGKTTLLTCMMKKKKKLTAKHVPTGLAVYHNVMFRGNTPSWTVWDLGGDSLAPFHPWFLLSRSIFVLVFDAREVLSSVQSRLYYWLNEITIARSRGDKKLRTIIPVGTHMEGIAESDTSFLTLSSMLQPKLKYENIPMGFLLQLSSGRGWKCTGETIQAQCVPMCVDTLVDTLSYYGDAMVNLAPQSWLTLNEDLRKAREKGETSTLTWTQFLELACRCGVKAGTSPKIEECLHFLAEIGTIIHFRYPFWLLSPTHPGASATPGLRNLVIMEPRSFLKSLLADICSQKFTGTSKLMVPVPQTAAAVATILHEFNIFTETLVPNRVPSQGERCLSLFNSPHSAEDFHHFFYLFWKLPVTTSSASNGSLLNGRVIQIPLFTQELLFKVVSKDPNHPSILRFQASLWTGVMRTLHHFRQFMYCRFEETESPFRLDGNNESEDLSFPCPHCLLKAIPMPEPWLDPSRSNVLSPTLFYFRKCTILDAVKNKEQELICGREKCQVRLDAIAPDLGLFPEKPSPSPSASASPTPVNLTQKLRQVLGAEQLMTLGDLFATLIKKANGTTSVLDQVIPNSLRVKILKNVAQELKSLHCQYPAVVHCKICPENILVLSLDDSGHGPWGKIKDFDQVRTILFDRPRIPESAEISPADMTFLAPEVLSRLSFDTAADVWSFGITASLVLDPLNKPYTHIKSNHKYLSTDYSSISHNNQGYKLALNPLIVGRHLFRGDITPFPPTKSPPQSRPTTPALHSRSTHNVDAHLRLVQQIVSLCLHNDPQARPSMDALLRLWDYFLYREGGGCVVGDGKLSPMSGHPPVSATPTCQVCSKNKAKYVCPKCRINYCSIPCYKTHNGGCTESFYRDQVMTTMKTESVSPENKSRIEEILRREQEAEADDTTSSELLSVLEKLDLGDTPPWEIMATMSEDSRQSFLKAIEQGSLTMEPWSPWWRPPLIQPLSTTGEEEKPTYPSPPPECAAGIPSLTSLMGTREPSSLLGNSLLQLLYTYVYVIQVFNGDWSDVPSEACDMIMLLSPVIADDAVYQTVGEALFASFHATMQIPEGNPVEFSVSCFKELNHVLKSQAFVLSALSELLRVAQAAMQEQATLTSTTTSPSATNPPPEGPSKRKLMAMTRKLTFMLAWVRDKVTIEKLQSLSAAIVVPSTGV